MSKQNLPIYLCASLLLMVFTACGGGPPDADGDVLVAGEQASLNPDSIRQLYQQLLAARTDTLPVSQVREAGKLYPVDEAPRDTHFFIFREQLQDAVQGRNLFHLMDVIHPQIKVDFGDGSGVADFVTTWQLDTPEKAGRSPVWGILENVLSQGGVFTDGGSLFTAPYIFATWPQDFDAYEYVAITGSGVRVRSAPSLQSQTLTMVSYDIVKRLDTTTMEETIGGETHPWVKIQLPDEREGYVYGKYVHSPIGYRAAFEKQPSNKWLMTFLLAGD